MKNPEIKNNSEINVQIVGPHDTRSVKFFGANVGDPSSIPIKFAPFSDSIGTKYSITLTTENENPQSLYIQTDDKEQPVFITYYQQSGFKDSFQYNINHQIELFKHRTISYNIVYLSIILLLNIYLICTWRN